MFRRDKSRKRDPDAQTPTTPTTPVARQTLAESPEAAGDELSADAQLESPAEPVRLEITDILDLHMFAPRDVAEVVGTYLDEVRAKGFQTVRIIHGKGIGAQRATVRSILAKSAFVASYQDAPAEAGGWGATIVWLKR